MTSIHVTSSLDALQADLLKIKAEARPVMRGTVHEAIKVGNDVAKDFARRSAGAHGKHYPRAFSAEMKRDFNGFGASIISGEYGPDIAKPQGGMSFEFGSRNQKPHLDLARSADLIGGSFAREALDRVDGLFW